MPDREPHHESRGPEIVLGSAWGGWSARGRGTLTTETPRFPAYGDGGDQVGARRARRAFRWAVLFCLTFTAMLWVAERHLRYDQAERLYLSALALPPESGRVMLRQAVLHDDRTRESPTPKYLQALAERELDGMVLPVYEEAHKLDPGNAALAIGYGCRRFHEAQAEEARELFHEAATNAPDNALPAYLEASTLPWVNPDNRDLADSLAIIARTNSSSAKPVVYPRPLWSSDLPQGGHRHAELSRDLVLLCSEPLYRFTDHLVALAQEDISRHRLQYWDSWLGHIQTMGRRIAVSAEIPEGSVQPPMPGGSAQAQVGLYIELKAVEQREHVARVKDGQVNEKLMAQRLALEGAIEQLRSFDEQSKVVSSSRRTGYTLPLRLGAKTLALFTGLYAIACILGRLVRARTTGRTVPHALTSRVVLLAGPLLMLLILTVCGLVQRLELAEPTSLTWVTAVWWLAVLPYAAFGLVDAMIALPPVHEVCRPFSHRDDFNDVLRRAKKLRRAACATLIRRYYATAAGTTACVICLWSVGYRVLVSLYPWQIGLLTSGLSGEEAELVRRVLAQLAERTI
jgi:tetratricopeptide (TPR) repeat protein